jgi:putative MATE family efflux protein
VLNIRLDLVFVLVVPWGVAGVAIATVIAQWFSWVFGIVYINKKYPKIAIHLFGFKFDKEIFKQIIKLGLPAGIQQSMFAVGAMAMTRLVNTFGSSFAAGYSAANKLDTFAFLPIQSIAIAVTTFTGQNIGAGKIERVRHGARAALIMGLGFSVLGLLLIPTGPWLMRLFSDEPAVIASGMAFLNRIMPFYWMLAILFVLNSTIRGAGESVLPMISSVLSFWLARVPCAYLFAHFFGPENLNFGYAAGFVVSMLITVPYYLSGKWKNHGITRAGSNLQAM